VRFEKIGLHIIKGWKGEIGQPPLVVLYNCDAAYYHQVRAEVGDDCVICFRPLFEGSWGYDSLTPMKHPNTVFQLVNEPAPTAALLHKTLFHMGVLHDLGLHAAILCPSVGQFDPKAWPMFQPALDAMEPGDYVGVHEYWGTSPHTSTWHTTRWRHVPELEGVPLLVLETGRDYVPDEKIPREKWGHSGWRAGGISVGEYLAEIEQYDEMLRQWPNVRGAALYTNGVANDPKWTAYDCNKIWPHILYNMVKPEPPVIVPPVKPELWPLRGNWHITQGFGANPGYYAPMLGHNGIDMVSDQPEVWSMSDGWLYRCSDPCGYGLYAYVVGGGQAWAYAHLAECREGGPIKAGDYVGLIGYSGKCLPMGKAGWHLHCGLRYVHSDGVPSDLGNGYRGYVDWTKETHD